MYDRSGSTRHSARYFPTIFINNYAARLREGRQNALLRAAAYQFSMRRLDNYFPLPDPFHAVLSKTAGLGMRICPRARAFTRAERAPGDRGGALLSKLYLPCVLSYTDARRHSDEIKSLKRRQSKIIYLAAIIRLVPMFTNITSAKIAAICFYVTFTFMLKSNRRSFSFLCDENQCISTPY